MLAGLFFYSVNRDSGEIICVEDHIILGMFLFISFKIDIWSLCKKD